MGESFSQVAGLSPEKRAQLLDRLQRRPAAAPRPVITPRRLSDKVVAVSFAQQRLWFVDQLTPGDPTYNLPYFLRLRGQSEPRLPAMVAALREIVRRHEALRTTFAVLDDNPVQVIDPEQVLDVGVVNLSALPPATREARLKELSTAEMRRPFDLREGPLFRATLVRLAATDHALLLTMHHIISDGWSLGVLGQELSALYTAFAAGRPSPLPPPPIQYADFAVWQRQWLTDEVVAQQLAYWREHLAGELPVLELPSDRPRPAKTFHGAVFRRPLSRHLLQDLKALNKRYQVTPFMSLLATFAVLLGRYSGQHDIVVGSVVAGRTRPDFESIIGFFVNMLVLRVRLDGDPPLSRVLPQVRETTLGGYAHQDLPFDKLVDALRPSRDVSRTPLFQVSFTLRSSIADAALFPGFSVSGVDYEAAVSRFDLGFVVDDADEHPEFSVEYSTDLFDATTVGRLTASYETLLQALVTDPEQRLSVLPLATAAQRAQMITEWNDSGREFRDGTIPQLFEAQVERTPEGVAATFDGAEMRYGELNRRANQLAHHLRSLGIGAETLVGLCVERSLEMVVGMMGILKAGAAYLPLDPTYPPQRLAYMLSDARAPVLVTQERLLAALPEHAAEVVCLDRDWPRVAAHGSANPEPVLVPDHLAYAIYTSGSTGLPKGVLIKHRAVANFVSSVSDTFAIGPGEQVLQFASICFDVSVFEIFGALLSGATLCLGSRETLLSPELLSELMIEQAITVIDLPPAVMALLDSRQFPALRVTFVGLEKFSAELVNDWALPGRHFFNGYGPTETTVSVVWKECRSGSRESPPIGLPMPNHQMYIVDRHLHVVPVGAAGALCIGGVGLARGYHRRPALTAEKFIPDPYGGQPGARLYFTGDVTRYLANGDADFLGRVDDQVKIRGLRIELGEVQQALSEHPAVKQAVVMVREDEPEQKRLVAYLLVTDGAAPSVREMRSFAGERLPAYMIPSAFVTLNELPMSPSGKVDRRRLPVPETTRTGAERDFVAPRTAIEKTLVEQAFAPVLGVERVSVDDNFFELGGNSLQATQVISRVRRSVQLDVPLRLLFESPTVAGLARAIEALRPKSGDTAAKRSTIPRRRVDGPVPVSFAQQRLWFLDQLVPGNPTYNVPYFQRLRGPLEVAAMMAACRAVVRRHEMLRTTFDTIDDNPVQIIAPQLALRIGVVDLSALPAAVREAQLLPLGTAEMLRPFDLHRGPLLRVTLLRLAPADHMLLLTMHHIATDGWSMGVLAQELSALYTAATAGRPSPLPPLPIQYADFAVWQRQWLSGEVLARQLAYWREQLSDLPVLELPSDRPRPAIQTFRGAILQRPLGRSVMQALKALARRHEGTLFMPLLAAYMVLLQRHSGQQDIVVGSVIAGRTRPELESLIGFFVNMLVLRSRVDGNPPFSELLRQIRETTLGAHTHQDLPFEKLVDALQPNRDVSRTPLFQVSFTLQSAIANPALFPGFSLTEGDYEAAVSRFDLGFVVDDADEHSGVSVEYSTDLFDATTVGRLTASYETLLKAVVADPEQRLSALPLTSAAQRAQMVTEWNDSGREFRDGTIPQLFEAQVARTPEGVAVTFAGAEMRYGELNRRANQLAHHLRSLGVGPEVLVGLCTERSLETVVGMMGILKAGAAYLPLDPTYPPQRLAHMLADARAPVLVTQERLLAALPEHAAEVVCLDRDWPQVAAHGSANPTPVLVPDHLAYAIYTSGSTGLPKGVLIKHRAVANFISSVTSIFAIRPGERVLQFASICFDVSVFETFSALLSGATLCLGSRETLLSPELLSELMIEQAVTVTDIPPAMMALMKSQQFTALRIVFVGGEKFGGDLVRGWALPGRRFFNGYGPTESTVTMTLKECPPGYDQSPPIGVPMPNHEMYVLDRHLNVVPIGTAAELHIGGAGLTRGYHRRPRLTAEKLVPDPFSGRQGSRLYRTGDLVRYLANGDVDFLGRIDDQVKIRGLRIELGEIEQVLTDHPAVKQMVVMVREDEPDQKRLVAYLVVEPAAQPSVSEIRRYLGRHLPAYMIPSAFVMLDELPTSPSGKVDRRRLPVPESARPELDQEFVAPRTAVEKMLAEQAFVPVLGVEHVGVDDNFFELGGNSLQATQLISRVRRMFALDVPLRVLFESPTIAGLARAVEAEQEARSTADTDSLRLLDEIEELSEEEVERLLAAESGSEIA